MNDIKWIVPPADEAAEHALAEACGIGRLTARVLLSRGMETPEEVNAFLSAETVPLTDPAGLADMPAAADRVRLAIRRGEKAAVIGDYDADGVTAIYILSDYLRSRGLEVLTHIPDRAAEGYGVSLAAVERLAAEGAKLILTVDTGITAFEPAERCRALGVDLIVTDHHACKDTLPDAAAVVDPWRPDSPEIYRGLAGAGVAFKLVCALEPESADALLARYADVLCLGTVADVMPLTGENRRVVIEGLKKLSEDPNRGLAALMEASGTAAAEADTQIVSFRLAPRVNAAGRMGSADTALRLLQAKDAEEASRFAEELCRMNAARQETEQVIRREAEEMLRDAGFSPEKDGAVFLLNESWHPGVVGIVCARLADEYNCPVVLATRDGDRLKASARSVKGFHLYNALSALSEYVEQFGGHELAAGLTLLPEQAPAFGEALRAYARERLEEIGCARAIRADCAADAAELTEAEVRGLSRLAPFGEGNAMPLIYVPDLRLEEITGLKENRHSRLTLRGGGGRLTALYFGRSPASVGVVRGETAEALCTVGLNEYRGRTAVNLYLRDIRPAADGSEALWKRFAAGGGLAPEEARRLLPERDDFIRVWRAIRSGEPIAEHAGLPADGDGPALCAGKLCAALRVLNEAGLTEINEDRILPKTTADKADLEQCETQRRLRALAECR